MSATYLDGIMFLKSENYEVRVQMYYDTAVDVIESFGYTRYTTATRRGYIKRSKDKNRVKCLVTPYNGRYGKGFSIHVEDKRTAYHEVVYYVK